MALQRTAGTSASVSRTAPPSASPAPPKPQRVSGNPDTFVSGGLINDIDVTITDAGTTTWDMNGAVDPSTPFFVAELTDENGNQHTQYWSNGQPADWQPDESGEGFVSPSGKTVLNNSSNFAMLLQSLVDAGFPKEQFDDGNFKVIIGTKCHVIQKTLERQGLIRTGKNASRPSTVLLVSKIYSLPGADTANTPARTTGSKVPAKTASTAKPAGGKPNGQAAGATAAIGVDELDEHIVTALKLHLAEAGGPVPAKVIAKAVFEYFNANDMKPSANKAVARSSKQEFRALLNDNGFVYDGSTLALAEE
jgi:hypothetical protein